MEHFNVFVQIFKLRLCILLLHTLPIAHYQQHNSSKHINISVIYIYHN